MNPLTQAVLERAERLEIAIDAECEALQRVYSKHSFYDIANQVHDVTRAYRELLEICEAQSKELKNLSVHLYSHEEGRWVDQCLKITEKKLKALAGKEGEENGTV
jgi:hypothetical protein